MALSPFSTSSSHASPAVAHEDTTEHALLVIRRVESERRTLSNRTWRRNRRERVHKPRRLVDGVEALPLPMEDERVIMTKRHWTNRTRYLLGQGRTQLRRG